MNSEMLGLSYLQIALVWKQIRTRPFDWVYLVANPC